MTNSSRRGRNDDEGAHVVKVVLLGDTGVGKSSIALRFVSNEFKPYSESTIGASFLSKTITVETTSSSNSKRIAFKIWDTAGQERYACLAPMYYRGAGAAILVYDICKISSFKTLQRWMEELRCNGPPNIALIVCGNKSDLAASYRQVDAAMARAYSDSIGATFFETSAKDDWNINVIFEEIARKVTPIVEDDVLLESDEDGKIQLDTLQQFNYRSSTAWLSSFC